MKLMRFKILILVSTKILSHLIIFFDIPLETKRLVAEDLYAFQYILNISF